MTLRLLPEKGGDRSQLRKRIVAERHDIFIFEIIEILQRDVCDVGWQKEILYQPAAGSAVGRASLPDVGAALAFISLDFKPLR